eukprot:4126196-Amphidinium_carterae.1
MYVRLLHVRSPWRRSFFTKPAPTLGNAGILTKPSGLLIQKCYLRIGARIFCTLPVSPPCLVFDAKSKWYFTPLMSATTCV